MLLAELLELYRQAEFAAADGRVMVYLDGRLAAEVIFHDRDFFRRIEALLTLTGKLKPRGLPTAAPPRL